MRNVTRDNALTSLKRYGPYYRLSVQVPGVAGQKELLSNYTAKSDPDFEESCTAILDATDFEHEMNPMVAFVLEVKSNPKVQDNKTQIYRFKAVGDLEPVSELGLVPSVVQQAQALGYVDTATVKAMMLEHEAEFEKRFMQRLREEKLKEKEADLKRKEAELNAREKEMADESTPFKQALGFAVDRGLSGLVDLLGLGGESAALGSAEGKPAKPVARSARASLPASQPAAQTQGDELTPAMRTLFQFLVHAKRSGKLEDDDFKTLGNEIAHRLKAVENGDVEQADGNPEGVEHNPNHTDEDED